MAGIYIHIPFCISRCGYCDFYSTTDLNLIEKYIQSIKKEISYCTDSFRFPVGTIYFGGGTPSLLKISQIEDIISTIYKNFDVLQNPEITCECNPDDLNLNYLKNIKKTGINRLSIGIQSLSDEDLKIMRRRHNAKQAIESVEQSIKAGFKNISLDFIYGLPWGSQKSFSENLKKFAALPVQHLSAYHLSIEKGTPFFNQKMNELEDTESFRQYLLLCETLIKSGMIHYEVSNFCLPDFHSQHNSSYWQRKPYLGLGAGAHSCYSDMRSWNKQNIELYISDNFDFVCEYETLSEKNLFNEKIMLGLRTKEGIDLKKLEDDFKKYFRDFIKTAKKWVDKGVLFIENNHLICREEKWFIVDGVIGELFEE